MRLSLPTKVGLTLLVNLILLAGLFTTVLLYQSSSGLQSLLLSPSQDRVRAIASAVAEELAGKSADQRAVVFTRYEAQYGFPMLLYDRDGEIVQGAPRETPPPVLREIVRPPDRPFDPGGDDRHNLHPVFLVRDHKTSLYWIGVHIPMTLGPDGRRARHALLIVTPTLLGNRLFFDWRPWALTLLGALLVSTLCWAPLIRSLLHTIELIRRAAGQIAEGHFEVEVPSGRQDELGELAASIHKMAEKLSRLVHGQRRFLADVAHELCAPLSRIQLGSGILQQRLHGPDLDYMRDLERDVAHMSNLVGDLLSFSKGAARKPAPRELALAALVDRVLDAEVQGDVSVKVDIDPQLTVFADEEYLRRALANVVRNAVVYAGASGPIQISSMALGQTVRLFVSDQGPGLPESELDAVFEPFYRPDTSRDRETGGAGLGLAIVRGCVEACGGSVYCANRKPRGLEVTIEIPRANSAIPATVNW